MKLYSIHTCLLLLFSSVMGHSQEFLLRAHEAYQMKDFPKAFEYYHKIPSKGSMAWYALAHCAMEMKDYPRALVYFRRCIMSASPALLKIVYAELTTLYDYLPHAKDDALSRLEYVGLRASSFFSLFVWQALILILLFFVLIVGIIRPKKYRSIFLILVIMLVVSILLLIQRSFTLYNSRAIILKDDQNIFVQPDFNSPALKKLFAGQEVVVREQKNEWLSIRHKHDMGWLPKESVEYVATDI